MSIKLTSGHVVSCCFSTLKKNKKFKGTKTKKRKKRGKIDKTIKVQPHTKKRNKYESVQAQMPLLNNTLLVSQTV